MSQKSEQFPYELFSCYFLRFVWILGVPNAPHPQPHPTPPHTHPRRQCQSSVLGDFLFWKTHVYLFFMIKNKIEEMILKRLHRVAFVGWDVAEASLGRITTLKHPSDGYDGSMEVWWMWAPCLYNFGIILDVFCFIWASLFRASILHCCWIVHLMIRHFPVCV